MNPTTAEKEPSKWPLMKREPVVYGALPKDDSAFAAVIEQGRAVSAKEGLTDIKYGNQPSELTTEDLKWMPGWERPQGEALPDTPDAHLGETAVNELVVIDKAPDEMMLPQPEVQASPEPRQLTGV